MIFSFFFPVCYVISILRTLKSKNDINFIDLCDEIRAYVEEHHYFLVHHTTLNNKNRCVRKNIGEVKQQIFTEISEMGTMDEHTGGRSKVLREFYKSEPTKS